MLCSFTLKQEGLQTSKSLTCMLGFSPNWRLPVQMSTTSSSVSQWAREWHSWPTTELRGKRELKDGRILETWEHHVSPLQPLRGLQPSRNLNQLHLQGSVSFIFPVQSK